MHRTTTGDKIKCLIEQATKLERDAKTLSQIDGGEDIAESKHQEAKALREEAEKLRDVARLEDLNVYKGAVTKKLASGKPKDYDVWLCSWRSGNKTINKHLGSCSKMSHNQAMVRARTLKAEFLGI